MFLSHERVYRRDRELDTTTLALYWQNKTGESYIRNIRFTHQICSTCICIEYGRMGARQGSVGTPCTHNTIQYTRYNVFELCNAQHILFPDVYDGDTRRQNGY